LAHTAEEQRAASELRAKAASDQEQKARRSAAEQQRRAELARQAAELEERGTSILRQFQSGTGELEALQAAIGLGRALMSLVPHRIPVSEFPASSPVMALNSILAGIREENRLSTGGSGGDSLAFSPDGGRLAIIKNDDRFVGGGRSIWIWETAGKPLWHCAIPGGTAISTLEFDNANRGVFAV
jgi:hypothetical protein